VEKKEISKKNQKVEKKEFPCGTKRKHYISYKLSNEGSRSYEDDYNIRIHDMALTPVIVTS
jgi:hypothetical protein